MGAPAAAAQDSTLATLLDDELGFDATTTTRLSNHLPMALVALQRLGASDARLEQFARGYRSRLAPLEVAGALGGFDEWLASRGASNAYAPARTYFEALIDAHGIEHVVRQHADHLVDGLSGAAFHGIIRLAYALEASSAPRVAAGLAYLTQVHQRLGERGSTTAITEDPLVALRRLAVKELRQPADGNIGDRMRQVAAHPSFDGVVDWLAVTPDTPRQLTAAAVALYAVTDDFTALHGVTASHAITIVSAYVEDTAALSAWWFQGLAAAYVTIGAPRLGEPAATLERWLANPSDWGSVARAATASDDEHVVKLVYTARWLDERDADPLLLAVATRRAGLAPLADEPPPRSA